MYCIYYIINKINGKGYVGCTKNIPKRLYNHSHAYGECLLLHRAIKKYGWINFEFKILEETSNAKYAFNVLEPKYIKKYNTHYKSGVGYNISLGGEAPMLGRHHKRKTKLAASKRMKKKQRTKKARQKVSEWAKNLWKDPKMRKKMLEARKGRKLSKKHINAIRKANKGRKWPKWRRERYSKQCMGRPDRLSSEQRLELAKKLGHPVTIDNIDFISKNAAAKYCLKKYGIAKTTCQRHFELNTLQEYINNLKKTAKIPKRS